jgi:hypothetical protein
VKLKAGFSQKLAKKMSEELKEDLQKDGWMT